MNSEILEILKISEKEGIKLILEEGNLSIKSKKKSIDSDLLQKIRNQKELLISYLEKHDKSSSLKSSEIKIVPFDRDSFTKIPLSFNQERLWFLDQLEGTLAYHIPTFLRLEGNIDVTILEEVLKTTVSRHEILRTNILSEEGIGYQEIVSADDWFLEKEDVENEEALTTAVQKYLSTPFDLSSDYKLRACLYHLGQNKYVLACVFHHIASDGWSGNILTSEFVALYSALQSGREITLPALGLQYIDYAIWQRKYFEGEILDAQLAYWEGKLKGVDTLILPLDYARPSIQNSEGGEVSVILNKDLSLSLKALCQQEGVTMFMFLLSAFKVLLSRYSSQEDICVGTPIANRTQAELEGMIGFFVNTLALRSDLSGNPSFKTLLKKVKTTTLEGYKYQQTPFEKVVDKVVTTRDMSLTPLFQVMFDYHNEVSILEEEENGNVEAQDFTVSGYENSDTVAQFDLTLDVSEENESIGLSLSYSTALFKEATIVRMLEHYKEVLKSIADDIEQPIGDLSMLTSEEENQLLTIFNSTDVAYPLDKTVVDVFRSQVQKSPDAIAAVFEGEKLTYQELDKRSNQLAHYLVGKDIQPNDLVGICIDRNFDMLIGILGILKSGAAYVPIKPDFPKDRIAYVLEDAACALIVTNDSSKESLIDFDGVDLVELDAEVLTSEYPVTALELAHNSNDLAYVIYTSGSTGLPKGAMIEHAGLLNHSLLMIDELKMNSDSVVAFTAPFTFDISVWQMLSGLLCGGCIAIYSEDTILDLNGFQSCLVKDKVSHLQLVPSYVSSLLESGDVVEGLSNLSYFLVTGEAATKSLLDKWFSLYPSVPVVNAYGPAEASDDITLHIMEASPSGAVVPIGKPVANMDLYVVDKFDNLCPVGVVGELWTSGIGVGRGYLNRAELTKEKFITNPFLSQGGRLYRTGDLGRWLEDGTLEFVGRTDDQVKIRGYRIELGEIENALSQVNGIQSGCVLAKQDAIGTNRLVGYVVVEGIFNKENIQEALKNSLPDYMVPTVWIALEEMPLTANGKIDRKALPKPDLSELSSRKYVAPRNETEEEVALVWQELLGVKQVGIYDDFFELGGHSLLATRLVSMIRTKMSIEISIRDVFEYTELSQFTKHISTLSERVSLPAVVVEERPERIPLSFSQERLWFLDELQGTSEYHMPIIIRLEGTLDIPALEQAFKTIITRHEILRTNILSEEGYGYQEIISEDNWSLTQEIILEELLEEHLENYVTAPFDLSKDYKLRSCLYEIGNEKYVLATVFHHIASDGWSEDIIISEFLEAYSTLRLGKATTLPELTLQYADYAIWQHKYLEGEVLENQLTYWEEKLTGVSTLELPLDYARPATQSIEGAGAYLELEAKLTASIRNLCQQENVTPFMFLLSAFKVLLSRYSGQKDICVGTPIANRTQSELEGMIGFFVNTIALRSDLNDDPSFRELLKQVKQTTLEGYENQLTPFEKVVDRVVTTRNTSITPLFQIMFMLEDTSVDLSGESTALDLGEVEISEYDSNLVTSKFDITMSIAEEESNISLSVNYCTALFNQDTINRMLTHYKELLNSIVNDVSQPISNLSILTREEAVHLLEVFNATAVNYPQDKTVLDVFTEQVSNTPEATALIYKEEELSYRELDARSNQLAHYLIKNGVESNDFVGICLSRGLEMLVGILGILKSGGAYVPIDPSYPEDRISYMLADADINLVVSTTAVKEHILQDREGITIVAIDGDKDAIAKCVTERLNDVVTPANLAYVIYTSGSTGKPKGVPIRHKNLVNYIISSSNSYSGECVSGAFMHLSMSFDASMTEIFTPLVQGKRLVISSGEGLDIFNDENLLKYAPYDFIKLTPSHLELLSSVIKESPEVIAHKYVLGGEALQPSHVSFFKDLEISATIINEYGPTEATVGCTTYSFNTLDANTFVSSYPIGVPMPNMQLYVVDEFNQLVPQGVIGELCIGGVGLSSGYLNREELTAEKFIDSPFEEGEKIYKTGDLGKLLSDGNLEFVGRKDDQVKIRGYRIELGEIENVLSSLDNINQSCVLAKEDANGVKSLVGYAVVEGELDKESVQQQLKESLPDYMVPSIWIELEEMPLTTNGKLDKKALPEPDGSMLSSVEYVAPRNETEEALVAIWNELLGVEKIGVYDDFFELGGHSLLATRLVSLIRKELEKEIAIRDIFEYTTISDLALYISTQSKGISLPPVTVEERPEYIPLSFSQERLWFLDQFEGTLAYHIPILIRMEGELDIDTLELALKGIVARHEILRTNLFSKEGIGYQKIVSEENWSLEKQVLSGENTLESNVHTYLTTPFNLSSDYKLKACIYDLGDNKYVLACIFHHIASDGWSENILTNEFTEIYDALKSNREVNLPVLDLQYVDYAIWQRKYLEGEVLTKQLAYWEQKLTGVSTLALPLDYIRPSVQSTAGATISLELDEELSASLKRLYKQEGVTSFMLLLSAFKVLLSRYSGSDDICVGTPIANRTQFELEDMIGFFTNTLALRTEVSGEENFKEIVARVKTTTLEGYDHQLTPFERVVDRIVTTRDVSMTPLFQVMFDYYNDIDQTEKEQNNIGFQDVAITPYEYSETTAQFDLMLNVNEDESTISLNLVYCTDLFKEGTVVRMLTHYKELLKSIVNDIDQPVSNLSMLTKAEEKQLLNIFNDAEIAYPLDKTVVDVFMDQVEKSPDATAATFEGEEISYKELDERSNQLAHYLIEAGAKPDALIGICLERGLDMLVGVLGILKSGGAYVPIKPDFPMDRISYIIEDTGCSLLVTDSLNEFVLESLLDDTVTLVALDDDAVLESDYPTTPVNLSYNSNDLAYVIYTSGSTGLPKGAMIEHAGLLNHSLLMIDELKMNSDSVVAFTAPFTFDISVWQMLSGLLCGGCIAIYSEDTILDLDGFQSSLLEEGVSHLQLVPSYVGSLLESGDVVEGLSNLSYFLVTGEAATKSLLDKWFSLYPSVPVVNAYGPAEAADDITLHIMEASPNGVVVPIGKPVANMDLYVVDKHDNLCPVGVVGELWTSGIGVGRGYLNRAELTKEKFITNPFLSEGGRLYKTGDLGRWLEDGTLEFVGRSDDQVKIRGYRIELGEIENALSIISGVHNSCVLAKQDSIGTNRLVGYVVVEGAFDKDTIQESLKDSLPDYMVPMIWVELEEMPLTANGKIDRKSLPEPDSSELSSREYVAPRNESEKQMALIWQELLGIDKVGVHDDFFELGGHSLLATRLVSMIRKELKKEVEIAGVFEHTEMSALAEYVSSLSSGVLLPSIKVEERTGRIPLSFSQERLWFLDQLQGTLAYHMPIVMRLENALNVAVLEETLKTIVGRHEVLRTNILSEEGYGYQEVISQDNWSLTQKTISENQLEESLADYLANPFDLAKDYKLRGCLYDLGNEQYILACVFHHIASDGWSEDILIREFDELYSALLSGKETTLPELTLQYADYAIWQRKYFEGEILENQLTYWENKLKDASVLELPTDYIRPAIQSTEGANITVNINEELTKSIKNLCKQENVTSFMFLLSAFKVLLSRYSGQEDVCIGTPIANRTQSELEGMIGFFVNTLVLRSDMGENSSFKELLDQVKATTLEGYDNQLAPFEKIVDRVITARDMSTTPLFQVMFSLENATTSNITEELEEVQLEDELENVVMSPYESEAAVASQFDLTLDVTEEDSAIELSFTYCTALFKEATIVRMLAHYEELLKNIVSNIEQSIGDVSMLTSEEEVQILATFNATETAYPLDKTVVDIFANQVQKNGDAVAAIFEGQNLTYKELDQRSNQLAHYLIAEGVQPNDLVGICIDRSFDMLIGVLGILKSGGAYVPIKPDFPADRISYLIEDTGCALVVTNTVSKEVLSGLSDITILPLDDATVLGSNYPVTPVNLSYNANDLAYVIYTSGSTGLPKGAMIEHAGLLNHSLLMIDELKMDNKSVVAFTAPFTFDISVWQMLSGLLCGGCIAIYDEDTILDLEGFQSSLSKNKVSHLQLVPSYVSSLLESGTVVEGLSNLSHFLITGEAATKSLLDKWFTLYPSVPVVNAYGPAEASDDITLHIMETSPSGVVVPIGKPVANMDLYVVDRFDNLCPIGVIGELWTSGIGVGRGYLNRAELTKEKFINNPFKPAGGRLYKTGDLGRWLPDGTLEFVGRTDDQVKIRGYRIELGEIENALSMLSGVQNNCVLAKQDPSGINRLVGYIVVEGEFNKEKIQDELKEVLPDYMVPMVWIALEEMPLTANGKIDKKSLPEPDSSALSTVEYVAPRNETEEQLAAIWQDLLGVEKVGIYDDFFELGGHSLLIVQLIARLQKLDYNVAVKDIFLHPTIVGIVERLSSLEAMYVTPANGIKKDTIKIIPDMVPLLDFDQENIDTVVAQIEGGVSNIEDMYPLSPLQEGIYFHYLMSDEEEGDPYILPTLLSFENEEKRTLFVEALQFVVDRHDVLRTCFVNKGLPNAVQVVLREAPLLVEELNIDSDKDFSAEIELLVAPGRQWMDVSKAPLLQLKSVYDPKTEMYYLIVYQHHLALDHIGLDKVVSEIVLYSSGRQAELPTPVLYRDFIGHTLHSQATNDSESYFKGLLGNIDEPTYPFALSDIRDNFSDIKESQLLLPEELSEELRKISISSGMSTAVIFHAAFGLVIGRCSNTDYAIFGSLLLGRLQGSLGAADSLGLFINTLPFLTELKGSIKEYIAEVNKGLTELLAYEQTPLSDVHTWSGISNEIPLFSALLNFRHSALPPEAEEAQEVEEEGFDMGVDVVTVNERTNYPISLDVDDYGKEFVLTAQIDGSIDPDKVLAYMQEALSQLLAGLKEENTEKVDTLTILPKEEVQLLETFNATEVDYPLDKTFVNLFTDQALKSPEAVAAIFEGEELTYKTLEERSNQLAHYLVAQGVQPNDLVGICLDRGLEMIIGVVAILKSGGAYVPIKPDFPADRISYLLEDTNCSLLVTNIASKDVLGASNTTQVVVIDDENDTITKYPITPLEIAYNSNDLAYVIYTSGSTGLPKGAMIEHAGLLNHLLLMVDELKMTNDSVVAFTAPFTFDISVWQMLSGLLCGGQIVIYGEEKILDISGFQNSLFEQKVSHLQLVPSYVASLIEDGVVVESLSNLSYFLVTGEAATKSLLDKWFELYPSVPVVNAYGPAEAADDVTLHIMHESPKGGVVPIGKPVANMDLYIVDKFDNLCPIGVIGEIWTSGIGVGRGYLNREELTREKFINNPFKSEEERLYKTGDLGRWLADGTIEFVGRSDDQVKIRGYRIELGEIENTIASLKSISQCCVLAKKDPSGVNRLVVYLVVEDNANKEELQAAVAESLPNYMIPQLWFVLEEMPLTANGKIDKKALPEPDLSQLSSREYVAPRNEIEEELAAIWQELLGVEKVGIHDDFFELGGHSLLATRLVSLIRTKLDTEVSIRDIFEETTIEEQASLIEIFKSYLEDDDDDDEIDQENYIETIEI